MSRWPSRTAPASARRADPAARWLVRVPAITVIPKPPEMPDVHAFARIVTIVAEHAYAEVTQAVLSSLSTVDSAASARTFVSQAANKIREASASVRQFYPGEFFNVFKDAAVAQAGKEIADCHL